MTHVYITNKPTWTVPNGWNDKVNSIECIGGGDENVALPTDSVPRLKIGDKLEVQVLPSPNIRVCTLRAQGSLDFVYAQIEAGKARLCIENGTPRLILQETSVHANMSAKVTSDENSKYEWNAFYKPQHIQKPQHDWIAALYKPYFPRYDMA